MANRIIHEATATMVGYGEILPSDYTEGEKLPVGIFMHGIGEKAPDKTLTAAVDFHYWLKTAVDKKRMIWLVPQDNGQNLFDDKELVQLIPIIKKYWDGRLILAGLSRGGGTTISTIMSNSILKTMVSCYLIMCPPTWEGMDEKLVAVDDTPTWIFAGAKDAADPATKIDRIINTVDDILKAGRKKNFYFSVFPNDDHNIWTEVMGRIGVPPISPADGAASVKGFNTVTKIVNGVPTSAPVAIELQTVNNPAVDVYDFALLQRKGDYKPLPLLSDKPEEEPAPIPMPPVVVPPVVTPPVTPPATPVFFRNFIDTRPVFGITWSDGTKTTWRMPTGTTIKEVYTAGDAKTDKQYLKIVHSAGSQTFGPKK